MSSAFSFSASSSEAWAALCELSDPSRATRIFLNNCFDAMWDGSAIYFTVFVSNLLTHTQLRAGRKVFALASVLALGVTRVPKLRKILRIGQWAEVLCPLARARPIPVRS